MKKLLTLILVGITLTLSSQTLFKNNYVNAQTIVNSYRFVAESEDPCTLDIDSLIAGWLFNGDTLDCTDNNNDLTNNGAVLTTDRFGDSNSAYDFDGLSHYMSCASIADIRSISVWVASDQTGINRAVSWRELNGYTLFGSTNWTVRYEGQEVVAGDAYSLGTWYHLVAVHDGSDINLYVDNTFIGSTTVTRDDTAGTFYVGQRASGGQLFNGKIDDVRIFSGVLTTNEITTLYEEGGYTP